MADAQKNVLTFFPARAEVSSFQTSRCAIWVAAGVLVLVATCAYWNSFAGAFVFDDRPATIENVSIRDWRAWRQILSPPSYLTTSGRPILNASLALSYALSGDRPWGYHALNLAIHVLAGLTLFGIMRRTLLLPRFRTRFGADALLLALLVAVIWTVHPLQTEAVTYIIQRAESLMGLFYLLTLYCFIRGLDNPVARGWFTGAVGACALGMGSKEVMASAPLIVWLYDRTFVSGDFRTAWRQRMGLYVGLACTWLLLAGLVIGEGGNRGGSIGFGVPIGWWQHGVTQLEAVTKYLSLAYWPSPLTFEYEPEWVARIADVAPQACLVLLLLALTGWAIWRGSTLGLLGAWFFAVLAPTSVMPAARQMIAEHRMYLPLVPLIAWAVLGTYAGIGRRGCLALALVPVAFAVLTVRRNEDYRSEVALWSDTVVKRPRNALAQGSLGNALSAAGRWDEALVHSAEAVRLAPDDALFRYCLGLLLSKLGRPAEAMAAYQEAIRLRPIYAGAHNNYGILLAQAGRREEARREFEIALTLSPDDAGAQLNFGALLTELGRAPEAIDHFAAALRLRPDYAQACIAWGTALASLGKVDEALARYEQAIRLQPNGTVARNKAGLLLLAVNRTPEAIAQFEAALQINPADATTRANLELARKHVSNGERAP